MNWISVEDRLPEELTKVLVKLDAEEFLYTVAYRYLDRWQNAWDNVQLFDSDVSH